MKIWVIKIGEPLPIDGINKRLHRSGILVEYLKEYGHQVTWWSSTYNHAQKINRFNKDRDVDISDSCKLRLLYANGYKNNISISRIINHIIIACKFYRKALKEKRPDIILCAMPTLGLSYAATLFGKKYKVPVVLDIRDLWPDIFIEVSPRWRGLLRIFLIPVFWLVKKTCQNATAITGITPDFVKWGVTYASRNPSVEDKDFPLGYKEKIPEKKEIINAENFWMNNGIIKHKNEFIICFFGNMAKHVLDLDTVIEAARRLKTSGYYKIRFVLCGTGDNYKYFKKMAQGCENVLFPGWVDAHEIWTLMRISNIGIIPYESRKDFKSSIPNKVIEYMSAGLPVVSSLQGILEDLLSKNECGITYPNGSAEELASVLSNLYENPDRLRKMANNSYQLYKTQFVAEKVYKEMIEYLHLISINN